MRRMGSKRACAHVLTVAALAALAGCDGPNQFRTPIGTTGNAPRVDIEVPSPENLAAKPVGDSVLVQVRVRDDEAVSSVTFRGVALRGDPDLGTEVEVDRYQPLTVTLGAVRDTVLMRYLQPTDLDDEETAFIIVEAIDAEENFTADTVSLVIGGPDVELLNLTDNQSVRAGLSLNLSAIAKDPQGVRSISFELSGAFDTTLTRLVSPAQDSVRLDTLVAIPQGVTGNVNILATALNSADLGGQDGVTVRVITGGAGDVTAPSVRLDVVALPKLELADSVYVQVSGNDDAQGSGVSRIGYTVRAISPARGDTIVRAGERTYQPPRTGTVAEQFAVPVFNVDSLSLPDTLVYEITGYMVDAAGNCAAANETGEQQSLACGTLGGGQIVADGLAPFRITRPHVAGRTVLLPNGGLIMDAAVDTVRRNLFLSNIETNQLEVFRMESETFGTAIGVGAEPWGLSLTRDGDSLWVANSGGTNMSVVDLDTEFEVDSDRFLTPDVVLFDIELRITGAGILYRVTPLPQGTQPAFSDRPQYMAVDSFGNVLYSTKTSLIGNVGTARKGFYPEGSERSEVRLFVEHGLLQQADNFWAVAHIDSVGTSIDTVGTNEEGDPILSAALTLYDHVPGYPSQVLLGRAATSLGQTPTAAWLELVSQGSDAHIVESARWNIPSLGFQDTTYVAASGDGGWVAFGEGASAPVGRVLMYQAQPDETTGLSGIIQVADLLTNPSEQVRGLGLNYDGTLGVVRGRFAAYYIDPDLRLQGQTLIPQAEAGSGAALHPLHANFRTLDNPGEYRPDTHVSFVSTGDRTVDIIDTQRYRRIGRVAIRDIINGPLRSALPFPEDNAGLTCSTIPVTDKRGTFIGDAVQLYNGGDFNSPIGPDGVSEDRCVVVKLYGTTTAGGVVVIDVRKGDILRDHPARN